MSNRDPVIYGTPQAVSLPIGNVEIGSYVVNDYLITVASDDGGNGYLLTIRKGSEVQTIHLTELTQETVNSSIETALTTAKESGEFDGNGIESVVFNPDYTLSLYFTDGTSYRTDSIRGVKGDTGTGVRSAVLNQDYTLTINLDDGTSYTTPSIRGQKGDKGDKGDPGDSFELHICSSVEYDHETRIPTVPYPRRNVLYLVPSEEGFTTDLFVEWAYIGNNWEKFGSASINLDVYAKKTELNGKIDKPANDGLQGQVLTSDGSGGQSWSSAVIPDWNAASGTSGFIRNKPDLKAGTGTDSITNRHSIVSGTHSMATGTNNIVSGADNYVTGSGNNAKGSGSILSGDHNTTELRGSNSLVGGSGNSVSNDNAIVAGSNNTVSGVNSTVNGASNDVSGTNAFASGEGNTANHRSQTVSGEYNVSDPSSAAATARGNYVEIIGNGTADNARSNARTLDWNGNEWIKGNFKMGGNSYDDPNAKLVAPIDDTAGAGDTDKTWSADKITSELANAGSVQDVTVDDISVVGQDGVAEIPEASSNTLGVVKVATEEGVRGVVYKNGILDIAVAKLSAMKTPSVGDHSVVIPWYQHISTFYGLAKAAGDTTQASSSNAVGTYTDNAKASIKAMLGVGGETQKVTVSGTAPVIVANQNTRYVCGEVVSLDFTPSVDGICDVIFTSGSTVTVLTIPNTVIFPEWFDPTSLEANKTYEISITDGVYGAVMIW